MINIFDVDYTVLKKASAIYFLQEALSQKLITISQMKSLPFEWLRYKLGSPNQDFIEDTVKHLAGIEQTALEAAMRQCFAQRMKAGIYTDALHLIEAMQKRGEKVIFATSSFSIMIEDLARFLNIDETIASTLEFVNGKTSGGLVGKSLFGINKKEAVAAWLAEQKTDPSEVRFYSDSYTDLPLLEYVGKAIAVNPDRFLKREALKRNWEILRFHDTIANKKPV